MALGGARPLKRMRSDDEALGRWAGARGRARGRCCQMRRRWGLARADHGATGSAPSWPRGVAASTLESASSDRGSNPREAFVFRGAQKERMLDRFDRRRARPEITFFPCRPFAAQKCAARNARRAPRRRCYKRPRGPMGKASTCGAGEYRLECCRGHSCSRGAPPIARAARAAEHRARARAEASTNQPKQCKSKLCVRAQDIHGKKFRLVG